MGSEDNGAGLTKRLAADVARSRQVSLSFVVLGDARLQSSAIGAASDRRIAAAKEEEVVLNKRCAVSRLSVELSLNCLVLMINEASRGVVLSTLFNYCASLGSRSTSLSGHAMISIAIALFSVGRLLANTLLGMWADRAPVRTVLVCALLLHCGGQLMYGFAAGLGLWALLLSRLLIGFGSGTLGVNRTLAASLVAKSERTKHFALLGTAKFFGYGLTPVVALALTADTSADGITFDSNTAPGFLMAAATLLTALAVFFGVRATPPVRSASRPAAAAGGAAPAAPVRRTAVGGWSCSSTICRRSWGWSALAVGAATFIGINFVSKGVLTLAEAGITPDFGTAWNDQDNDSLEDTVLYLTYLGLGGLLAFAFMVLKPSKDAPAPAPAAEDAPRRRSSSHCCTALAAVLRRGWAACGPSADPWLLLGALLVSAVGTVLAAPAPRADTGLPQMTAGFVLIWSVGAPIADTLAASLFSVVVSDGGGGQGSAMGYIGAAGSLGRILFPLAGSGLPHAAAMGIAAGGCVACAAGLLAYMRWKAKATATAAAKATAAVAHSGPPSQETDSEGSVSAAVVDFGAVASSSLAPGDDGDSGATLTMPLLAVAGATDGTSLTAAVGSSASGSG